ncbi:hypothetical protein R1flu_013261 [Riccia fluitans]|uniref:Peptidase A2 domain-containing protein n=1 Tax=Riccia fluitans TaxID=41844 RepID=A0ABD1YD36_9MARC
MEAKWLPPEEANSPMVASLFLRNMQPNISDPCCLQFQPGNCTMVQLYQGAQEIQKQFDWKGTRRSDITGRRKNPETPTGAMGKVAVTKTTAPSFATFAIATPMAPEIVDLRKFAGYRNQRGPTGQDGNGVRRPAPGCKALTPVLEDSEYNQSGPLEDDKKGVGDTPEVKVNSPQVENSAAPPRRRGRPRKDKAGPIGGSVWAKRKKETQQFAQQIRDQQVEVDRVHEIIFRQIKDAKISLTIDKITALSPVSKEFVVSRLAGELVPQHRLTPASSKYEPAREELGASCTSSVTPSEGTPVDIRAVRACYAPPMILVRIGEITFPRVLVDTGSGVNVMSNQIRIRLGYHRMAPPTTKLSMVVNTLIWPLGVLSAVPVVVEGIRLIVSFQVIEMEDPEFSQLILGRTWQKGARAIIDMDNEVIHIRAGTNLTTVKWSAVATPGTVQVQQAQPVEWNFADGFTDEDENQFLDDQPYIVPVAEIDETPAEQAVQGKDIIHWTGPVTNQSVEVNVGTEDRPKIIRIGATLSLQERQQYVNLLHEFKDVLAADYRDMKGTPPEIAEHRIDLLPNTRPLRSQRYRLNPNYAERVKKELDKLLEARFIYPLRPRRGCRQ